MAVNIETILNDNYHMNHVPDDFHLDQQEQEQEETGVYKTPPGVKKPKPKIKKQAKPKAERKPKNQTPKPHRDVVVRKPRTPKPQLDPNISPRTGKPKRKYVRRNTTATTPETAVHTEELQEVLPVQEDVSETSPLHLTEPVVQPALQQAEHACTRQDTTSQHTSPNKHRNTPLPYIYQISKRRTFKLVTRQEQGEYVPAQYNTDAKGNKTSIAIPSHVSAGRTVLDGQCSKCRVFNNGRIPIYYTTYEAQDGTPLPYLCQRCIDVMSLCWWNATEHDTVIDDALLHEVLHEVMCYN